MPAAVASFQGPDRIAVVPVLHAIDLFRVVNVDRPHHPGLVLDFTSNYERQARPRRIERFYAIIHMAISTFTTADAARALVERFPSIGTHIARLRLPAGAGFCIDAPPRAITGPYGARRFNSRPAWSMSPACRPPPISSIP